VGEGGVQGSGFLKEKLQRLVGDKAYDSDPLMRLSKTKASR
jgi:hypothetical protein